MQQSPELSNESLAFVRGQGRLRRWRHESGVECVDEAPKKFWIFRQVGGTPQRVQVDIPGRITVFAVAFDAALVKYRLQDVLQDVLTCGVDRWQ